MGMDYNRETDIVGGGLMGGGGGLMAIIAFFVIAWILFERRDGRDGRDRDHGYAHGFGCGFPPAGRPYFPDESNYEEERNINNKLCVLDKDVHAEGDATRALIQTNYIQDLRDKLAASDSKVLQLENRIYTDEKFGKLYAEIGHLSCELPKRPPVWADVKLPAVQVCHNDFPRRGRCEFAEAV